MQLRSSLPPCQPPNERAEDTLAPQRQVRGFSVPLLRSSFALLTLAALCSLLTDFASYMRSGHSADGGSGNEEETEDKVGLLAPLPLRAGREKRRRLARGDVEKSRVVWEARSLRKVRLADGQVLSEERLISAQGRRVGEATLPANPATRQIPTLALPLQKTQDLKNEDEREREIQEVRSGIGRSGSVRPASPLSPWFPTDGMVIQELGWAC